MTDCLLRAYQIRLYSSYPPDGSQALFTSLMAGIVGKIKTEGGIKGQLAAGEYKISGALPLRADDA